MACLVLSRVCTYWYIRTSPPPPVLAHLLLVNSTQAQLEILANPMSGNLDHSNAAVAPVETGSGTPVRPRFASMPSHLTPVGNWNATNDRSRLSGAGGSPTECLRDYLSGLQGKEEEEEEVRFKIHAVTKSVFLRAAACCWWYFFVVGINFRAIFF